MSIVFSENDAIMAQVWKNNVLPIIDGKTALEGKILLSFIQTFNLAIFLLFTFSYAYQIFYALVALVRKTPDLTPKDLHKFAVVIAARNESAVIGQLINSIKKQKYPAELVDIYVVADNCTDNTAEVARQAGAQVYVRNNRQMWARVTPWTLSLKFCSAPTTKPSTRAILSLMRTTCWMKTTSPK